LVQIHLVFAESLWKALSKNLDTGSSR